MGEFTDDELIAACVSIDQPEPVDLAIVPGCTEPGNDPDFALRNRVRRCVELFAGRYFCRVLLTGGSPNDVDRGTRGSEATRMQDLLLEHPGFDAEILLEHEARNTRENAERSAAMLLGYTPTRVSPTSSPGTDYTAPNQDSSMRRLTSIMIITCDYHTRRARFEFERAFPECRVVCCGFVNDPAYQLEKCRRELVRLRRLGLVDAT